MSRDDALFLDDIFRSCEKIVSYSADLTQKQIFEDDKTFDAILRNLEIVGEAVKRYPLVSATNILVSNGEKLLDCVISLSTNISA